DAFGSGGRLQTCYHVATANTEFLIDCGATAMIGFNGLGLDPNRVATIFISHLHGDHFSGLVWWMLYAEHVARRTEPLDVVGPPGLKDRYNQLAEALFTGSASRPYRFALRFHEIAEGVAVTINGVEARAFVVSHPSGAPSYALRFAVDGRVVGFSGDTEWVEALVDVARDADLYITECYGYETTPRYHMSWTGGPASISANMPRLAAKRILLTHMSSAMLEQSEAISLDGVIVAHDGMALEL
ncbi:MAG: MBL fold metallo-hydrolase, partial [Hyphomicrobiaceae bacterium]